jgi:ABC-type nitrate/sulfonate/bicarbonate transport system substrate-binding protein
MKIGSTTTFLAVLGFWLCLCSGSHAKTITLSYNTNALNVTLPILVAQELGFFAAEGLDVTAVFVRRGPTAMTALVSGSSDYTLSDRRRLFRRLPKEFPRW